MSNQQPATRVSGAGSGVGRATGFELPSRARSTRSVLACSRGVVNGGVDASRIGHDCTVRMRKSRGGQSTGTPGTSEMRAEHKRR